MRIKGVIAIIVMLLLTAVLTALSYFGIEIKGNNIFSLFNIRQGLDLQGGVYAEFEADKEEPTDEEINSTLSLLRRRLDFRNYTEANVASLGANRFAIEIPGIKDSDIDEALTFVKSMSEQAYLTFRDEEGNILLDGSDVVSATVDTRQDVNSQTGKTQMSPYISLSFSSVGTEKFSQATANNIGKRLSIYLDDTELSSPTVQEAITSGEASITYNGADLTMTQELENTASLIRSGALPFKLNIVDNDILGASLGADALETSIMAGIVGFVLVVLFMLVVYRLPGFAADWALVFYILIQLLVLSLFKITLTLPGIAGIVLAIGMAVDANVIIFERITEELNIGKTMKASLSAGFSRAFPAILDGNLTTLIAAFVLFWLGSGPVKGFAQTLILGIIVSMFTALVVTRFILNAFVNIGIKNPRLYGAKGVTK